MRGVTATKLFFNLEERLGHVLVKELREPRHGLRGVLPLGLGGVGGDHALHPRLDHVLPLEGLRDVEDPGAGSRWPGSQT